MALFAQKNLKTFDVGVIKITKSSFDSKASELRRGNAKCCADILYTYMIKYLMWMNYSLFTYILLN